MADPALTVETLPERPVQRRQLWKFGDAVRFLMRPRRVSRRRRSARSSARHPAWTRLVMREPIAQQPPSGTAGARREARAGADGTRALTDALRARIPFC
jgi:hypothetical protein